METIKKAFLIMGRFLLGAIFILIGAQKTLDWNAALLSLENALCEWGKITLSIDFMQEVIHHLLNWSQPFLIGIVACEILGGIFLAFAYRARLGASLLILVSILSTLLFHTFWVLPKEEFYVQGVVFLYRLGVIGGLFLAWTQAAGPTKVSASAPKK